MRGETIRRLFLRVHGGADVVSAGLLLDGWGDDGGVRDASLVEAVRWRGHHVRGEAAGDQAGGGKGDGQSGGEDVLKVGL